MATTTVLDSFIIELGLDASKLTEQERKALEAFRAAQAHAAEVGKMFEAQGKRLLDVFDSVKRGAVGIVGAFLGSETAGFIDRVAHLTANTGRLAQSMGVGVEKLSLWQNMVRSVGGTAEEASSSLAGLNDALTSIRMGSLPDSKFSSLLLSSGAMGRIGEGPDAVLRQITQHLDTERSAGRMKETDVRFWLQQVPGMSEHILYLLQQGTKGLGAAADEARRLGISSEKDAEAAKQYQTASAALDMQLMRMANVVLPEVAAAVKLVADALESKAGGLLLSIIGGATIGAGAGLLSPIPGGTILGGVAGGATGAFSYWLAQHDPKEHPFLHLPGQGMLGSLGRETAKPSGESGLSSKWMNFLSGLSFLESDHKNVPNAAGASSARGYFQFTNGTAVDAQKAGIADPREGSWMAQATATMQFIRKFHPDAAAAIDRGDTETAAKLLTKIWPSLPGGEQQQGAKRMKVFQDELLGGGPRPPVSGTTPSSGVPLTKPSEGTKTSTNVTVGDVYVTSSRADPRAVADETAAAIRRTITTSGANTGLA